VDWFNNRRLLEPIGNILPVEYEQACYQSLEAPARVAGLNKKILRKIRCGSIFMDGFS